MALHLCARRTRAPCAALTAPTSTALNTRYILRLCIVGPTFSLCTRKTCGAPPLCHTVPHQAKAKGRTAGKPNLQLGLFKSHIPWRNRPQIYLPSVIIVAARPGLRPAGSSHIGGSVQRPIRSISYHCCPGLRPAGSSTRLRAAHPCLCRWRCPWSLKPRLQPLPTAAEAAAPRQQWYYEGEQQQQQRGPRRGRDPRSQGRRRRRRWAETGRMQLAVTAARCLLLHTRRRWQRGPRGPAETPPRRP